MRFDHSSIVSFSASRAQIRRRAKVEPILEPISLLPEEPTPVSKQQEFQQVKFTLNEEEFMASLQGILPREIHVDNVFFVCIGTDRSTGDALGPMVGTLLSKQGYKNVIGTLNHPVHAVNLDEMLEKVPPGKIVIGIDACLGQLSLVGSLRFAEGPVKPGAGVKKNLTPVGNYHITGIVNVGGFMEYFVLQNTRLSLIMNMAEVITGALASRFPIPVLA